MKWLYSIVMAITALSFTSCGEDEPEYEQNGDWIVSYTEIYDNTHNDSQEFEVWFNNHLQYFQRAEFSNATSLVSYSKDNGDYIEWQDYSKWMRGSILWVEIIEDKSEDEVKEICNNFSSFSISDEPLSRKYDKFSATYHKLNE